MAFGRPSIDQELGIVAGAELVRLPRPVRSKRMRVRKSRAPVMLFETRQKASVRYQVWQWKMSALASMRP